MLRRMFNPSFAVAKFFKAGHYLSIYIQIKTAGKVHMRNISIRSLFFCTV